jgi:hypothetical protein
LFQKFVYKACLAVVDMRDYCDISYIHCFILKTYSSVVNADLSLPL